MPCLASMRWNCLATSPSMPPRMVSRYSTTVTLAPSRAQTEPSSSPITPPPTTTIVAAPWRAPARRSTRRSPSRRSRPSTPGMPATSEPVAMTMFGLDLLDLAVGAGHRDDARRHDAAGAAQHLDLVLLHQEIEAFGVLGRPTAPCGPSSARGSAWACRRRRPARRRSDRPRRTSRRRGASALDGMQPTLTQVPPCVGRFSTTAVRRPSWAALMAQT